MSRPGRFSSQLDVENPFMSAVVLVFIAFGIRLALDPLLADRSAFILFTAYSVRLARREVSAQEKAAFETEIEQLAPPRIKRRMGPLIAFIVLGLAMLVVGGDLLVRGAVALARVIGMDGRTIGLTIVAIGTGAPEIATSVTAALRKEALLAHCWPICFCTTRLICGCGVIGSICRSKDTRTILLFIAGQSGKRTQCVSM